MRCCLPRSELRYRATDLVQHTDSVLRLCGSHPGQERHPSGGGCRRCKACDGTLRGDGRRTTGGHPGSCVAHRSVTRWSRRAACSFAPSARKGAGLYATPTTLGAVCFYWSGGAGGCVEDLDASGGVQFMGIDPDLEGSGAPGAVVGVASDSVRSVAAWSGKSRFEAVLASGGFLVELPNSDCSLTAVESVVVTHEDGATTDVPIVWRTHTAVGAVCG